MAHDAGSGVGGEDPLEARGRGRPVKLLIARVGRLDGSHMVWRDLVPGEHVQGCLTAGGAYAVTDTDVRVVRGLTSDSGAFTQLTTRRITDFAKAGIRKASDPFIGKLNNERVRKALYGAIDGFLTTMVVDEHLITYTLQVTASRADEIAGRCLVNVVMQPVFSIDFIAVTLVLE